jgi:alkylhydroperoxidase family enzyme
VSDFSERERAALAWTEALTYLDRGTDYAVLRAQLRKHFSDKEIAVLTTVIAMINMWNRLGVSRH